MALIEDTAGVGDVGELYGQLAARLESIVRLDVHAPDAVIEDACQFAWSRLLHHRHRVHRETVISWLARTAVHEAFKLLRRDRREVPLDVVIDRASPVSPHELIERRERLAAIGRLPERQQRVLWLHALGLSYAEIAVHEQCTTRTVERQLLRAKQRVRDGDRP
jgi:RNA polymerase sigma factor (sigma-70 family)